MRETITCFVLLSIVALSRITSAKEVCGNGTWSANFEVNGQILKIYGKASEEAEINIKIEPLEENLSYEGCLRSGIEVRADAKSGTFESPEFTLCRNEGYKVMLSLTCKGVVEDTKEEIIWTAPEAPSDVIADDVTNSSILLRWKSSEGKISAYKINLNNDTFIQEGNKTFYQAENLISNTNYEIKVSAKGKELWSEPSVQIFVRTKKSLHPPILEVHNITNTTVHLTWTDQEDDELLYTVKWQKDSDDGEEKDHVIHTNQSAISVNDLAPFSNYSFYLRVSDGNRTGSWSDFLRVRTEPGIPSPPVNVTATEKGSRNISLEWSEPQPSRGDVIAYTVTWKTLRETSFKRSIRQSNVLVTNQTRIVLEGLKPARNYLIQVSASTAAGTGNWSEPIAVKTLSEPPFPPANITVTRKTENSISLMWYNPIRYTGKIEFYTVQWNAMNHQDMDSLNNTDFSCTILNLSPFTVYYFRLKSWNDAGPGNWSDDVEEKTDAGFPSAPRDVQLKSSTNSSIEITWKEPFPNVGTVRQYKVQWISEKTNYVLEGETFTTSYLIDELTPCTNYSVRVQAKTDAGYGEWSDPVAVQTDEGVPPPPENLRKNSTTNTSIEMTWDELSFEVGQILLYRLKWTNTRTDEVAKNDTKSNSYVIRNLDPYTNYSITVQASTRAGYGAWSDPAVVQTNIGVPPYPRNLREKFASNSSIEVEWESPGDVNGPVILFKIMWTDNDDTQERETKDAFYLIEKLKPYTSYSIQVQAKTMAGYGPCSSQLTVLTGVGVPSAPINIKERNTTDTSIEIEWSPPFPDVGPIETYRVQWRKDTAGSWQMGTTEHTFFVIENLNSFNNYSIKIQAVTSAGEGRWSHPVVIQTDTGVPFAPQNLTIGGVTNLTIEVVWEEPSPRTGPIELYTILWGPQYATTSELKFTIENLKPYSDYNISVRAKTEAGFGDWTNVLTVKTKIGIPGIPRNITDEDKNATYIRLRWLQPQEMNGPLRFYRVQWNAVDEERTVLTRETSLELSMLLPYTQYAFRVSASTEEGWGASSAPYTTRTAVSAPSAATMTTIEVQNSSVLYVEWLTNGPYPGPTTFQLMTWKLPGQCEGGGRIHDVINGSKSREEWQQPTRLWIPDLSAYSQYSVAVSLRTEAGNTTTEDSEPILTPPKAPGPPTHVRANCEDKSTEADISWSLPANPNAKISHYFVQFGTEYLGYREMSVKVNDVCEVQKMTLRGLRPEREYKIFVRAVGEGVSADGERASPARSCLLPAGVPPLGNPRWIKIMSEDPLHLSVVWNDLVFSDVMGSLVEYSVIVGKSESIGTATRGKVADVVPPWMNYSLGLSEFYQATPQGWNPFVKSDEDPLSCKFIEENVHHVTLHCTLGLENNCATNRSYCNGPLNADTSYWIKMRAFTRGGYSETGPLIAKTSKHLKSGLIGGVAGGSLIIICCVIFGIFVIKRNGGLEHVRKIIESRFLHAAVVSPQPETLVELDTCQNEGCIKIKKFCEHVRIMLADSHLKFSEEFEALKHNSPRFPCTAAEMEENRHKNRWMNIFPYDHSRVKLLPLGDEPASDFINANYIVGDSGFREYIASQGPLSHTVEDFWRMIWEQSSTMIVMLTQLVERGKVKCEKYWPDEREPKFYGDLQVRLISESMLSSYIIRVFHLQLGSQERIVKQMHFTHWPDFGCPEQPEDLINFVRAVRDHLPRIRPGPIVVHCSAGVGRTGTFIAVDTLAQKLQHSDSINIYETVMELRQHRLNMVQTEDQYIYIHLCVQQLVQEILLPSNQECTEPIYSNISIEDTGV